MSNRKLTFIDLFAGAGGLSEGFVNAGFLPIAHVELDKAACNTLLTRVAYNYLRSCGKGDLYLKYLDTKSISRDNLYNLIPEKLRKSVINIEIGQQYNRQIFNIIDGLKGKQEIDIIIGGPPCQGFSNANRPNKNPEHLEDSRNLLYKQFATFVSYYKPKYFLIENVTGILTKEDPQKRKYIDRIKLDFKKIGYEIEYKIQDVRNYGVLQNRKRVIIIGKAGKIRNFFPQIEFWQPNVYVSELFKDLPPISAGRGSHFSTTYLKYSGNYLYDSGIRNGIPFTTLHIARPTTSIDKEIYQIAVKQWNKDKTRLNYNDLPERLKTHKNRTSNLDRFKVVASDLQYSQTVVAHIAKDGHYYIHPDILQNRSLSIREVARLQSFPDDYYFEGKTKAPSRTAAFKQIGNAVPPLFAEAIAKSIYKMFSI